MTQSPRSSTPRQMTLALARAPAMTRTDFLISDCNRAALAAVEGPGRLRLAISGPEGCGKSHIAAIWAARTGAARLLAAELTDAAVAALADVPAAVIEDGDRIGSDREALLFHALNLTRAEGTELLITGRTPPARWGVAMPDLASRLAALDHVAIAAPDDTLLSSLLDKLFSDRQLTVSRELVTFLVRRMERSFAAAVCMVERLDAHALSLGRPITRTLARELLFADAADPDGEGDP